MSFNNIERLTAGKRTADKKKKARQNQIQEIKWDENARREFLTGFHKRKQQRIKKAKELAIERARLEKIEERKQRREAVAAELKERMRILRGEEDGSENSGDRSSAETEDDTQPHEPQQYRTQTTITTVTIE